MAINLQAYLASKIQKLKDMYAPPPIDVVSNNPAVLNSARARATLPQAQQAIQQAQFAQRQASPIRVFRDFNINRSLEQLAPPAPKVRVRDVGRELVGQGLEMATWPIRHTASKVIAPAIAPYVVNQQELPGTVENLIGGVYSKGPNKYLEALQGAAAIYGAAPQLSRAVTKGIAGKVGKIAPALNKPLMDYLPKFLKTELTKTGRQRQVIEAAYERTYGYKPQGIDHQEMLSQLPYSEQKKIPGGYELKQQLDRAYSAAAARGQEQIKPRIKPSEQATSALHLPEKNVYAKVTPKQLKILKDEVKNIPFTEKDTPHLTPLNSLEPSDAKEISLTEIRKMSPNLDKAISKTEAGPIAAEINAAKARGLDIPEGLTTEEAVSQAGTTVVPKQPILPSSKTPAQVLGTAKQPPLSPSQVVENSSSTIKYNTKHLNVNELSKAQVTQAIEEARPQIEQAVGKKLTNAEAINYANKTSDILQKTVGVEQTKKSIAANLNLRRQIARASQEGKVTPELIEAIVKDKAAGADIARQLQARAINADPAEQGPLGVILQAVLKKNDNTDEILRAAEGVDFNDANQATAFYRQFVKPTAEDWIDKLRYNSMLSSPNTHTVNIASNYQGTGIVTPIEKTITGGVDWLRATATGGERKAFAGEGAQYAKGYYSNLGEATKRFVDVMSGKSFIENPDVRSIPLSTGGVTRKVEKAADLPMRLMEGMDQFFSALTEGGTTEALKYRATKISGVKDIAGQAAEEAAYRLFRQDLNTPQQGTLLGAADVMTKTLYTLRSSDNTLMRIFAKFTLPFVRTGTNLAKQGVEYNPVGALATIPGRTETLAIESQVAKSIIGMAATVGATMLATSDRLSWAEPTSAKMKDAWRAAGKQQYSIKWGDKWISYSKLHPAVAFNLAMVAAIYDAHVNKKLGENDTDTLINGLAKVSRFFFDQTYVRNIGDALAVARGDVEGTGRLLANYPQQLVPFRAMMGWIARWVDPVQRKADPSGSVFEKQLQYLMLQIPGLSKNVPARLGPDNKPIPMTDRTINAISPARITTENPELLKVYNQLSETSRKNSLINQAREKVRGSKESMNIGDTIVYIDDEGTTHTLKPQEVIDLPSANNYEKAIKEKETWSLVNNLYDANVPDAQKQELYQQLGVTPEEADYYSVASQDNDIKTAYVTDELAKVPDDQKIQALSTLRKTVNGQKILADGVIDNLYNEGVISSSDKKYLKAIKDYDTKTKTTKLKAAGTKKAKKLKAAKQISIPKIKISTPKRAKVKKIKAPSLKSVLKPVKRQTLKALQQPKSFKAVRTELMRKR